MLARCERISILSLALNRVASPARQKNEGLAFFLAALILSGFHYREAPQNNTP
jgi:hypothetical protein